MNSRLYKKYISCHKDSSGWWAEFTVGVQSFAIGKYHTTKREAVWYGKMFAFALAQFLQEEMEDEVGITRSK